MLPPMLTPAPYLYTRREAASILRISPRTLGRWVRSGILRGTRVGPRLLRFTEAQIDSARKQAAQ
jgi:excisionase family DNA binding protein